MTALRAVVIGAGWAGEGHATALRDAGVEVVALCGRSAEPTRARAAQLGISEVRLDWRGALEELRPDIVSIATPGDVHRVIAEHAAALGCHIVCEKPLAVTAVDARAMLTAAEQAGVQHAYAATACYSPAVRHATALVAQGVIGAVREIESLLRFDFPVTPYTWLHDQARGGGMLNNLFTHRLAQVIRVASGRPVSACGSTVPWRGAVPVGPALHDLRESFAPISDTYLAQVTEWRTPDVDGGYTVVVDLQLPEGHTARASFVGSVFGTSPTPSYLTLYGDRGALAMESSEGAEIVRHYDKASGVWVELPLPPGLLATLAQAHDPDQRAWNQFYRAFVASVQDSGPVDYPTFRDGWEAMEIIEVTKGARGWVRLPTA
jgi:predicted dehydrogenase